MRRPLVMLLLLTAGMIAGSQGSAVGDSLKPLFDATESFLDVVQPADKSILLKELVPQFINGSIREMFSGSRTSETTLNFLRSMLGYTILVSLGIFLIVFVSIAGCCVCCCRCCCSKCGGRINYMEHPSARCRRGLFGMFHLTFTTLILFGAVLAFLSNQELRQQLAGGQSGGGSGGGDDTVLGALSSSIAGLTDWMAAAPSKGRSATVSAVTRLAGEVLPTFNGTLVRLQAELTSRTDAFAALSSANGSLTSLTTVQATIRGLIAGHGRFVESYRQLNASIAAMTLDSCPVGANKTDCDTVNHYISGTSMAQSPNSTQLTEADSLLASVNVTELRARLDNADATLRNISTIGMEILAKRINSSLAQLTNDSMLVRLWGNLETPLAQISSSLAPYRNVSGAMILNPITGSRTQVATLISDFDAYRYYTYIGLAAFATLLAALFYLGLLWGVAGSPPYEDASCCNRGVGANFLLAGAGLGFIFYALVMLIALLLFLTGGLVQTEACRYLRNRPGSGGYASLDSIARPYLRSSMGSAQNITGLIDQPVTLMLGGCDGGSLADRLNVSLLADTLGLRALLDQFINDTRSRLANQASDFVSGLSLNITQLADLRTQAQSSSEKNFTGYLDTLSSLANITPLISALDNIISMATNSTEKAPFQAWRAVIWNKSEATGQSLADQRTRLTPLSVELARLAVSANNSAVTLEEVGRSLTNSSLFQSALASASSGLAGALYDLAVATLKGVLGSAVDCAGLGRQLQMVIDIPCARLLRPFNGFWAGIGLYLLGLLPCLVLAIKLANLYRKTQKYLPDMDDRNPMPI